MHALQASKVSFTPRRLFASVDIVHLQSVTRRSWDSISSCVPLRQWAARDMSLTGRRTLMMLLDLHECRQPKLTVHKLSLAFWSSSPIATEVLFEHSITSVVSNISTLIWVYTQILLLLAVPSLIRPPHVTSHAHLRPVNSDGTLTTVSVLNSRRCDASKYKHKQLGLLFQHQHN